MQRSVQTQQTFSALFITVLMPWLAFVGCGTHSPGFTQDDDQTGLSSPPPTTPKPGDDDQTGASTPTPGDDDSSQGDDDATASGDDDATASGDDDASDSGDDDSTRAGDDDASPSGDDDGSQPGDDDASGTGDDDSASPTSVPVWRTGAMLISDSNGGSVSVMRMSDGAQLWSYASSDYLPSKCSPSAPCQNFEVTHTVHEDRDYVDVSVSTPNDQSAVYRVAMDNPATPVFSLIGMDFSAVPSAQCLASVQDTCAADATKLPMNCYMRYLHGMQLVQDDPAQHKATMILADSKNGRVLQVSLDYTNGNTCGKVDWVLNEQTPSWDATCPVNDVQYLEAEGEDYLLVSCRNLYESLGYAQVQLFRGSGSGLQQTWSRVWSYPDPSLATNAYLNISHHCRIRPLETGGYELRYAHSDGLGTSFGLGNHGSMGSAFLDSIEAPPDYLADEVAGLDQPVPRFGFVKSIEMFPDGTRLVADAGSLDFSSPGSIYVIDPVDRPDDARGGYWTSDFHAQNLVEVDDAILRSYQCGWTVLYQTYWMDPSSSGGFMRNALALPKAGTCQVPPTP